MPVIPPGFNPSSSAALQAMNGSGLAQGTGSPYSPVVPTMPGFSVSCTRSSASAAPPGRIVSMRHPGSMRIVRIPLRAPCGAFLRPPRATIESTC